jgi:oligopeptide/dipeptide ABC transporter ATP-binding protein
MTTEPHAVSTPAVSTGAVSTGAGESAGAPQHRTPLLEIEDLRVGVRGDNLEYDIVRGVSLSVYDNEILAVVGESGCGKSLTALAVLALHQSPPLHITGGSIRYRGTELTTASPEQMRAVRGAEISMIFQDPMSALDPMFTVGSLLTSAVRAHRRASKAEATADALEALADAGIEDPRRRFDEYPFQLSGGVSQRVMIALALVNDPSVIIADEPTTALDVTVQAQILERLRLLKQERKMGIMLITHNLGVVAAVADRTAVMYLGEVVETGSAEDVLAQPHHPYTNGLLGAVPRLNSRVTDLKPVMGRVPQPQEITAGCAFRDRCDRAVDLCAVERPLLTADHRTLVRCHNPVD